jgi:hypothetical protein
MINIADFRDADIGKLCVVLSEAWTPRPAEAVAITTGTTAFVPLTGYGVLLGLSWTDTDGTAANTITIRDGADSTGPILAAQTVAQSSAILVPIPVPGVRIMRGLYVTSTAAGEAVLYVLPAARHD